MILYQGCDVDIYINAISIMNLANFNDKAWKKIGIVYKDMQ